MFGLSSFCNIMAIKASAKDDLIWSKGQNDLRFPFYFYFLFFEPQGSNTYTCSNKYLPLRQYVQLAVLKFTWLEVKGLNISSGATSSAIKISNAIIRWGPLCPRTRLETGH